MTSRERVRRALDHKKADRLPIDIGGLVNLTSLHKDAYRKLLDALGDEGDIEIGMMMHQAAVVSGRVRRRFHGDTAPLYFPVDEAAAGVCVQPDGTATAGPLYAPPALPLGRRLLYAVMRVVSRLIRFLL